MPDSQSKHGENRGGLTRTKSYLEGADFLGQRGALEFLDLGIIILATRILASRDGRAFDSRPLSDPHASFLDRPAARAALGGGGIYWFVYMCMCMCIDIYMYIYIYIVYVVEPPARDRPRGSHHSYFGPGAPQPGAGQHRPLGQIRGGQNNHADNTSVPPSNAF